VSSSLTHGQAQGKRALPNGARLALALVDARRFKGGIVHARYARRTPPGPTTDGAKP
jgi:hypothetical protein